MKASESRTSETRMNANLKKEERAREGAVAMQEYIDNGRIVRERMAQLRALRLANEAAGANGKPSDKTNKQPAVSIAERKVGSTARRAPRKRARTA
jgi:hypothetical protein